MRIGAHACPPSFLGEFGLQNVCLFCKYRKQQSAQSVMGDGGQVTARNPSGFWQSQKTQDADRSQNVQRAGVRLLLSLWTQPDFWDRVGRNHGPGQQGGGSPGLKEWDLLQEGPPCVFRRFWLTAGVCGQALRRSDCICCLTEATSCHIFPPEYPPKWEASH